MVPSPDIALACELVKISSGRQPPIEWIEFKKLFAHHDKTLKCHFKQLGLSGKAAECLVWIPYEEFKEVHEIGRGASSTVFKGRMKKTIPFGNEKLDCFALKEIRSELRNEASFS